MILEPFGVLSDTVTGGGKIAPHAPNKLQNIGVGGRGARPRAECQARGAGARWAGMSSVRHGLFGAKKLQNTP